jgi:diphthamide synthase (EF-2-diphthine--ammonia ligase)
VQQRRIREADDGGAGQSGIRRGGAGCGFRATVVCVDTQAIDSSFAGRAFDETLLADLPQSADPCGERGEFHTFVQDGPLFRAPISCRKGEVVSRGRFVYRDLVPTSPVALSDQDLAESAISSAKRNGIA